MAPPSSVGASTARCRSPATTGSTIRPGTTSWLAGGPPGPDPQRVTPAVGVPVQVGRPAQLSTQDGRHAGGGQQLGRADPVDQPDHGVPGRAGQPEVVAQPAGP